MKVLIRRLLWIGFYVGSLALVAAISVFYSRNFTGLGPIPDRSSFARRLPGTPDGDAFRYKFYYATNRSTDKENDAFDGDGLKLGSEISAGTFDVRISPKLPIKPWIWHDEDQMKIVGRNDLPVDEAMKQLREAVAASPNKSLLIIVWGWRDRFGTAALKTAYTAHVLDINTPVLLFDWPGNQGEGATGYMASRRVSHQSGPDMGRVLARVSREVGAEHVWLMGSSLGCQTIVDGFQWMLTQPDLADADPEIDHVVLSAADLCRGQFNDQFAKEIRSLSRHLTSYVASNDTALLMGNWLNRSQRLGRPGIAQSSGTQPTMAIASSRPAGAAASTQPAVSIATQPTDSAEPVDPTEPDESGESQFAAAADLLNLQSKGVENISVIDATPVNRTRNLHHFFTDSPEFFDDLYRHLLQPDNPIGRRLYSVQTAPTAKYWILWDY